VINQAIFVCHILRFLESARMMKAAVITGDLEPLEIKQVTIPQVALNNVLVKLIACGYVIQICKRREAVGKRIFYFYLSRSSLKDLLYLS